jgi:hypothetical protein
MATKRHLEEDEIEKQLICDSDSDCWTEEEADRVLDREFEDEDEPHEPFHGSGPAIR